jgi:hypothetical protein
MKAIGRTILSRIVGATIVNALVLVLGGAMFHSAAAGTVDPSSGQDIVVQLGTHQFGDLREPDAIVATVGPEDVGFYEPPNGEGDASGPQSFEVAPDGSIWLLDSINYQLLVWEPGRSTDPIRIALPLDPLSSIADFALGVDGTIYATYVDYGSETGTLGLCALTPTGDVLWTAPTNIQIFNAELLTGPEGAIYVFGADESQAWSRLTTPDGQPLPLDEQAEATTSYQPLAGEQGLIGENVSPTEQRFTLTEHDGQLVRAWHVDSDTEMGSNYSTPTVVDGDLVVALDVWHSEPEWMLEYLVLRLSPTGAIHQQFALDTEVWGDDLFAQMRIGPDGQLYQLRTDPTTGASIAMFSLNPTPAPAPSPSLAPAPVGPAPTAAETPAQQATLQDAPEVPPAASPPASPVPSPAASNHADGWNLTGLSLLGAGLIALGTWYWYVRRRRAGTSHSTTVPAADSLSSFGWTGEANADEGHGDRETVMVEAIQSSPGGPRCNLTSR